MAHQASLTTERNPSARDDEKRSRPFRAVLLMAWIVLPVFFILERVAVGAGGDSIKWLIMWLDLLLFGAVMPLVAVGRGLKVGKREPFVVAHVAITIHLFAVAASLAVIPGWNHVVAGEHWWNRAGAWLANVFTMPLWIVVVYYIMSLAVALSWLIYRIDAFRADPREKDGDGQSKLEKLLKFPLGARVRENTIEADEYAVTATIDHPGIPVSQVQGALPAMVEQAGAIRGRSSVVPGDRGGQSTVRLVKEDPLDDWKPWPGLSHPGLSFAYPFRTAYYTDGPEQWFSFAQTPAKEILPPSPVVPKFRSANDAHLGRQGATRSGKSGDNAIELAEAYSREDVIVCLVNTAKLTQDVGWGLDFAGLAADTKPKAVALFAAIRSLGEDRSRVMGDPRLQGRHRVWSPLTYEELGIPAILLEVDEGDTVLQSGIATWLATKGLSLGIFASVMISRAATDGMASTLRSAIAQWKCFGAGQAYDAGFVLSDETIAAGADPGALSTRFPGSQYLDKAQGVDETRYPVLARSYQTLRDFKDLRLAVEQARKTFEPAWFNDRELDILGNTIHELLPRAVLFGAFSQLDGTVPAAPGDNERSDMQDTQSLIDEDGNRADDTGDPEVDALLAKPRDDFSDLEREYGELPPLNEPLVSRADPNGSQEPLMGDGRPELPERATGEEFNAALLRLAARGKTRFGNKDVIDEMRCDPNPTFVSRRFKALCDDHEVLPPDPWTVERVHGRAGEYVMTRLNARPTDAQR